jgi:hypothetical protein
MANNDTYQCRCGGEVIPCKDFPEPNGTESWYGSFGLAKLETAKANPGKFICILCGVLDPPPTTGSFPPFWTDTCPI